MIRRISRVAALVATLTATLVCVLPSAHATTTPPTPINGFSDVHVHQFSNLAFGGLVVWGQSFTPDNNIETALPWDDWTPGTSGQVVDKNNRPVGMTSCPNLFFQSKCVRHSEVLGVTCPPGKGGDILNPCDGFTVHGPNGINDLVNAFSNGSLGHPVSGFPEFNGWPRHDNVTSQQVYYEWLKRAYDGGLRLMVMLAVNNEVLCKAGNHIATFGCGDMAAVDRQIQAAYALQTFVDNQAGAPGQGWYRIVTSPQQARQVTAAGKLAVVLGIEVDTLFDCNKNDGDCTTAHINERLDHYRGLGVRHIFPVHLTDNGYGGTAIYDDTFAFNNKIVAGDWWDYAASCGTDRRFHLSTIDTLNDINDIPIIGGLFNGFLGSLTGQTGNAIPPRAPEGPNCNARGLTPAGIALVNGLIDRKMIMDVDHMDVPTFDAAMTIAETRHYPGIVSGHTGIAPTANSDHAAHEGNKTLADIERIRDAGGLLSVILHQGGLNDIKTLDRGADTVQFDCGFSDQAWAQVYLYAVQHMNGGAVGIGSDFNGLAGEPAGRFGADACDGDKASPYNPAPGLTYPIAKFGGGTLDPMQIGNRTFNYNDDGLANIGLYPDFIADLHQIGLTDADLAPLFGSAEAYVRMWERAEDTTPPEVTCAAPPTGWNADNVGVACTASDYPSGMMTAGDASFTLATSVADGTETSGASTDSRNVCDKRNNCVAVGPFTGLKVDRKAPVVTCASPDSAWHASDVSVACTSTEGGSGLVAAGDASFALTTTVAAGTETSSAATGSRNVCDAVGHCSTAGPYTGLKVDKKAPTITITSPAPGSYLHNTAITLAYAVADGGSGVAVVAPTFDGASTLAGHGLASGQAINLLLEVPSGSHSFAVQSTDAVGNTGAMLVSFDVVVTPQVLRDEVSLFRTEGDIEKQGIATSLLAKLNAALASRLAGNCSTAASQYGAFINEVQAQSGKAIDPAVAAILIADANYLIAHCP